MARSGLEERLEEITRRFVAEIVTALREASFAEVAALEVAARPRGPGRPPGPRPVTSVTATPKSKSDGGRQRQTADRRAELGERVLKALQGAEEPMGVRALSSELGVAADLLAAPLRELRDAGRIAKHGEKRATTYSPA
jgi:hypothetical protein